MKLASLIKTILRHELLCILLFFLVLLRIPNLFEPYWYGDEAIYLVLGQGIRHGLVIYRDIIDHKTPIIYFLAAVPSQFWFKFLLMFWTAGSVVLLYLIGLRVMKSKLAAIMSAVVFMLATTLPAFEGHIANGELFVIGFILAGTYLFTSLPLFHAFMEKKASYAQHPLTLVLAGMFLSLGILTKIPAVLDLGAILCVFLFMFANSRSMNTFKHLFISGLLLCVGIAIPIAASIAYFAANNALNDYWQFGLIYNFRYSAEVALPFTEPLLLFIYGMKGKLLILSAGVVAMLLVRRQVRPAFQFIFSWSMLTLFATLLSSRPYPHYWIQTFPPLSLLIGYLFMKTKHLEKVFAILPLAILVATLFAFHVGVYSTVTYYKNFIQFATKQISTDEYRQRFNPLMLDTYATAEYIKKRTAPTDRLFIWGDDPMLYALADRLPVGRFTVAFHIKDFKAYDETLNAFKEHMPPVVVVMKSETGQFGEFYAMLAKKYVLIQTLPTMKIYHRVSRNI